VDWIASLTLPTSPSGARCIGVWSSHSNVSSSGLDRFIGTAKFSVGRTLHRVGQGIWFISSLRGLVSFLPR